MKLSPRRRATLIACLLAMPLGLVALAGGADAGTATSVDDVGHSLYFQATVYVAPYFYLLGGHDASGAVDDILRWDPLTGATTTMGATLPTARYDMAAATDGRHVYLFGGWDGTILDDVLRYDPVLDQVAHLGDNFTSGYGADAVYDGASFYVVGGHVGYSGSGGVDDILRYSPLSNGFTTMGTSLPSGRGATAAIWDGTRVVAFGGCEDGCSTVFDDVFRFDPVTDTGAVSDNLPFPMGGASAAWTGTAGVVFGGATSTGVFTDQILVYDPLTGTVSVDPATMPTTIGDGGAAHGPLATYHFGGNTGSGITGDVVRYT